MTVLRDTTGRIALHSHVHSYRDEAVFGRLPDAATARAYGAHLDIITGQHGSTGEVVGQRNPSGTGFLGKLPANGVLTYAGGARAEPDLAANTASLVFGLYYSGQFAEGRTFGRDSLATSGNRYFPAAWYDSTAPSYPNPDQFGNYIMDGTVTSSFSPSAGDPWDATMAATLGWDDWVPRFAKWMIDNHPAGGGVHKVVFLDNMNIHVTNQSRATAILNAVAAVFHPLGWLVAANSMESGALYFSANRPLTALSDISNLETFLHGGNQPITGWPTQTRWLNDVSAIIDVQKQGKYCRITTKMYDNTATDVQMQQWRALVLASYLIANRGKTSIQFQPFGVSENTASSYPDPVGQPWQGTWKWWNESPDGYSIYGAYMGASTSTKADADVDASSSATRANLYQIANASGGTPAGLYGRTFAHGMAVVNLTGAAQAIPFTGTMVNAQNMAAVTSPITLQANRGLILWDQTPAPPPASPGPLITLDSDQPVLATPLTASASNFPGTGPHSWTVLWQRSLDGTTWATCSGTGATTPIASTPTGAASATYTPDANDVGKHLRVTMANTPTSGSGGTFTTAATVPVVTVQGGSGKFSLPAEFAAIKSDKVTAGGVTMEGVLGYHVVGTAPEPSSYSFNAPGGKGSAGIVALRGVDPALLAAATPKSAHGTGGTVDPGPVATSGANGAGLQVIGTRNLPAITLPGSWDELRTMATAETPQHQTQASMLGAPSAGTVSATSSSLGFAQPWIAFHVPLDVSGPAPPPATGSLTVTLESDLGETRLQVATSDPDAVTVTITRVHPSGDVQTVRGFQDAPLIGGALQGWDYELPIGREVTYHADFADASGTVIVVADPVTLLWDTDDFWLGDPLHPGREMKVRIEKGGYPQERYNGNVVAYNVLGRWDPVVKSSIRSGASGSLSIITTTLEEEQAMHLLTGQGGVLLLRTAPRWGIGSLYFVSQTPTVVRTNGRLSAPERRWLFDGLIETRAPVGSAVGGRITYDDILAGYATYDELASAFATYDDLSEGTGVAHAVEIVSRRGA